MRRSGLVTVATGGWAILVCMGEYADGDEAAMYNYRNFDAWVEALGDLADEAAFAASPSAGQRAPDFTLPRLGDGAPVSLSGLWRSKPLVMEFGSFT
jgi:hypothetical protein